jgi:hypothetical protein
LRIAESVPEKFDGTADLYATCCDCGDSFVFETTEQKFFIARGLLAPRRCKRCRTLKRERNEQRLRDGKA